MVLFSSLVEMNLFSTSESVVQVFITNALAILGMTDLSYIQKVLSDICSFISWVLGLNNVLLII